MLMMFCKYNFEYVFFERAILKNVMKNNYLLNTSFVTFSGFSIKSFLTYKYAYKYPFHEHIIRFKRFCGLAVKVSK